MKMKIVYFENLAKIDSRYCGYVRIDVDDELMTYTVLLHAATGKYSIFYNPHDKAHYYGLNSEIPNEIIDSAKTYAVKHDLPNSVFDKNIMSELEDLLSKLY